MGKLRSTKLQLNSNLSTSIASFVELNASTLHFTGQASWNIQETIGFPVCSTRFTIRSRVAIGELSEDSMVSETQAQRGDDVLTTPRLSTRLGCVLCLGRRWTNLFSPPSSNSLVVVSSEIPDNS